jgi:hypothetical protein
MSQMNDQPYQGGQQPPSAVGSAPPAPPVPDRKTRDWAMGCHLMGLLFFVPLGNVIGPLVFWLLRRQDSPFIDDQGKESLNFQITIAPAYLIGWFTTWMCVGWFVLLAMGVIAMILVAMAAIKVGEGISYRYPFALRLVK